MSKNKKFMVILAIFMLGAILLTGCGGDAGEETELDWGGEESDFTAPADEKEVDEEETAPVDEEATAEDQATITASATLKAVEVDAGTITIVDQSGDELVLKVSENSKMLLGESLSTLAELATVIDSEVDIEYHAETKTVMAISIED